MVNPRRKLFARLRAEGKKALRRDFAALRADDPPPFSSLTAGPLTLDFSHERLSERGLGLLLHLADKIGLEAARDALFAGAVVNPSEKRAALHAELRATQPAHAAIASERARALAFAETLRAGDVKGAGGKSIRHLIHVGIGGSDVGPRLLVEALADGKGPHVHFAANADSLPLQRLMNTISAEETLVLLVSKTFSTAEMRQNGNTLLAWLQETHGAKASAHLIAVTAARDEAMAFGVPEENIFALWDFIGGRFSLCSSVSLSAMAAMGAENFKNFLHGAEIMDAHFKMAPLAQNLPILVALLAVWNVNALGLKARIVLPYAEALSLWPCYVQQLEMESLGKSVDVDGMRVDYATAPMVFGASGTPAQHAFMQGVHQGTQIVSTELLLVKNSGGLPDHQQLLQANAVAQGVALAYGKPASATGESDKILAAQKAFDGGRPSSLLVLDDLSPATLGSLVALHEHKVFALGHMWNINPFDQWGVELGKQLATPYLAYLCGGAAPHGLPPVLQEIKQNGRVLRQS